MRVSRRGLLRTGALGAAAALAAPLAFAAGHGPRERLPADKPPGTAPASRGPGVPAELAERAAIVQARPFTRFSPFGGSRVDGLDFVGGMDLSCDDRRFGGFSALSLGTDGRLLSLSDRGTWLSARLVVEDGRPVGLANAVLAPMLGPDGRPLTTSRRFDTESLALVGGTAYVGIERVHEVLRFNLGADGLAARGEPIPVPGDLRLLPKNKGLEALGLVPRGPLAGRLIGIAEQSDPGPDTPTRGFVLTGGFAGFAVARSADYDISDLAFLPGGDMLLLERSFALFTGVRLRIRRIAAAQIRPGALLDGPVLVEAGMASHIDNMEGLAVHRAPDGGTVLTLISDDNFSALQKTVLLQFRLAEGAA